MLLLDEDNMINHSYPSKPNQLVTEPPPLQIMEDINMTNDKPTISNINNTNNIHNADLEEKETIFTNSINNDKDNIMFNADIDYTKYYQNIQKNYIWSQGTKMKQIIISLSVTTD